MPHVVVFDHWLTYLLASGVLRSETVQEVIQLFLSLLLATVIKLIGQFITDADVVQRVVRARESLLFLFFAHLGQERK